jgi:hypothetical protein
VMDMVQPDVAGEELQDLRQPQIRATAERRVRVAPVRRCLPVRIFELVLHVEQPDPDRSCEQGRRCPYERESDPCAQS